MADGRDWDDEQHDAEAEPRAPEPARPTSEGVRILGAEEAQAALETGAVSRRLEDDELRYGDVPPRPDPSIRPTVSFPRPATGAEERGPTWSATDAGAEEGGEPGAGEGGEERGEAPAAPRDHDTAAHPAAGTSAGPASGPIPLPHWTEPPTGEVPQILPEAEVVDATGEEDVEELAAAAGRAPRFRTATGDWVEEDYEPLEDLGDETSRLGALAPHPGETDEDEAFERDVQARRRIRHRTVSSRPSARPVTAGRRGRGHQEEAVHEAEPFGEPEYVQPPDLATRVITGVGIAVLGLICLKIGANATAALATVIVGLAALELFQSLQSKGFRPASVLGILGAIAMVPIAYNRGDLAFTLVPALVVLFTMLWYVVEVVRARPVVNIGATLLGFMYVGFFGGFAGLLLSYQNGVGLVLGLAICAVGSDVFGYLVGSQFGKTRIAPTISPNKTLEGLVGGMVASVLLAVLIVNHITPWKDMGDAIALGLTVAFIAPIGDLCESLLKRDLGIKDFGSILPGHGGVLDRFDAILFSLPAVYFLALALKSF